MWTSITSLFQVIHKALSFLNHKIWDNHESDTNNFLIHQSMTNDIFIKFQRLHLLEDNKDHTLISKDNLFFTLLVWSR